MKIKFKIKGFRIADLAEEYYAIFGNRERYKSSFSKLKKVDHYFLPKSIRNIYERYHKTVKIGSKEALG